jgi:4-carboxymuconolactone decarboxylase
MRLLKPRLAPLQDGELKPEQAAELKSMVGAEIPNSARTLAHAPAAFGAMRAFGAYLSSPAFTLSPRQREILILRIARLSRCGYEWSAHVAPSQRAGLQPSEAERIKDLDIVDWDDAEAALIRAADDLQSDQFISEAVWRDLARHFSVRQCLDVVLVAGQYLQLAMVLNTMGVQCETSRPLDPEMAAFADGAFN